MNAKVIAAEMVSFSFSSSSLVRVIFEGREIRIQVSGFVSCAPHSERNTMGELGEQCSERYARPRSRLTSNTRRFVGGISAERERAESRERTAVEFEKCR